MTGIMEWTCERLLRRLARRNLRLAGDHMAIYAWDYIGLQVMIHGVYEGDFLAKAMRFLRERGTDTAGIFLDIGANIGNHAVYFSRTARRVLAFEPNPKVFRILEINTDGKAIEPWNCGLSDRDAMLTFQLSPDNLGESQIVASPEGAVGETTQIFVRKYDGIAELTDLTIDVMKIDVEFHEYEVLSGCREMIARSRPAILFEQMAGEVKNGTSRSVEFLRDLGYTVFYFGPAFDLPKGIRGIGGVVLRLFGSSETFRLLTTMRSKSYNLVAIANG